MRKEYVEADVEIIVFRDADIITESVNNLGEDTPPGDEIDFGS